MDEQLDCHCGHSWYDHIGWRMQNGEYDRSNCRIVRCGCECYTEKWQREYEVCLQMPVAPGAFDPGRIYGNAIHYTGKYTAIPQDAKDVLHKGARDILPPGQYYELRGSIPVQYGGKKELYWAYEPPMASFGIRWNADLDPPELHPSGGYCIIGGYFA